MSTRAQKAILFGIIVAASCVLSESSALADTPHGRDCATAATIELNTEAGGTFADTDDRVVYRIVLERRGLLDVWTEAGNLDLWDAELLDSSCNKVAGVGAGNSVVRNRYMRITVPHVNLRPEETVWTLDAGVYFLRFSPDPVDVFGDPFVFHTSFVPHYGHDIKTAEYVSVPAAIEGVLLYPEDREVFRVQLPYAGEIHAWTTGSNESAALPSISLSGSSIANGNGLELDGSAEQAIQTSLLEPGDYYLSLEPMQRDLLGPFTLHVEFMKIH